MPLQLGRLRWRTLLDPRLGLDARPIGTLDRPRPASAPRGGCSGRRAWKLRHPVRCPPAGTTAVAEGAARSVRSGALAGEGRRDRGEGAEIRGAVLLVEQEVSVLAVVWSP